MAVLDDGQRPGRGRSRGSGSRGGVRVGVDAAAGLAAQPAGLDEGALREGRGEPRVVAERGPHRPGDRLVHVVADQVHQRERPHPEAAGPGQHRVDGGRGRRVLLVEPPRFGVVGPGDPVHDEPGRSGGTHHRLPPPRRQLRRGVRHLRGGSQPRDDLHELHGRHGIKEVQPDKPPRMRQPGGHRGRRQRGGIGREHAVRAHDTLKLGEQRLLRAQLLHDRLSDHAAFGEPGDLHGRQVERCRVGVEPPLLDLRLDPIPDLRDRALGRTGHGVGNQHSPPRHGSHLRDPGPHRPRANDPDRLSHRARLWP